LCGGSLMAVGENVELKWMDIVPPEVPTGSIDSILVMVCAVLIVALLALGLFLYRHPKQKARRALRRLAQNLTRRDFETRAVCFGVRQCLSSGLGHGRLQSIPWDSHNDNNWMVYLDRLTRCCFAPEPPSVSEADHVIREALAWLNKKPVRNT